MEKYLDPLYTDIIEEDFIARGAHLMLDELISEANCSSNGIKI